jgi:hypothetical protein
MTLLTLLGGSYRIPASQTPEGRKRLAEYYEALGRFVDVFSRVEAAVTLTLWHYAKAPPEIAKVVFSGTKVDVGSQYIKQIASATNVPQELREDLEDVLQQLGIINRARNYIMHYGAEPESVARGNAIVSDALKAKGEPTSFPISPILLEQMTADLHKIITHLNVRHLGKRNPHTLLTDPIEAGWRYKQPDALSKKESSRRK